MPAQQEPILSDWYKIVRTSREILQGDLLDGIPIIKTHSQIVDSGAGIHGQVIKAKGQMVDCVVLTQSCDIENTFDKDIPIFLCPRQDFSECFFPNRSSGLMERANSGHWKLLTKGSYTNYCLLDECRFSTIGMKHQVVNLSQVYTAPLSYLTDLVGKKRLRLRLVSPYLEYVSQQLARQFMRVGLPSKFPRVMPAPVIQPQS